MLLLNAGKCSFSSFFFDDCLALGITVFQYRIRKIRFIVHLKTLSCSFSRISLPQGMFEHLVLGGTHRFAFGSFYKENLKTTVIYKRSVLQGAENYDRNTAMSKAHEIA